MRLLVYDGISIKQGSFSTLHLKNNNKKQVIMRLISANPV